MPIDIAHLRRALGLPPALLLVDLLQRPMDPPPAPSANMADICHYPQDHTVAQDEGDEQDTQIDLDQGPERIQGNGHGQGGTHGHGRGQGRGRPRSRGRGQ